MRHEEMTDKQQRISDVNRRIVLDSIRDKGKDFAYGYMAALWENGLMCDEDKDACKRTLFGEPQVTGYVGKM